MSYLLSPRPSTFMNIHNGTVTAVMAINCVSTNLWGCQRGVIVSLIYYSTCHSHEYLEYHCHRGDCDQLWVWYHISNLLITFINIQNVNVTMVLAISCGSTIQFCHNSCCHSFSKETSGISLILPHCYCRYTKPSLYFASAYHTFRYRCT